MLRGPIAILTANATIQALIGQNETDDKYKVYPVIAPQTEKAPYITVAMMGGQRSGKGCGRQMQFVVACAASSYDAVSEIDEAVIDAYNDITAGVYEGVQVDFVNEVNLSSDEFNLDHQLYVRKSIFVCQLGE